ncbi:MAG TPA: RDD family protein [Candidatus Sulfotelmatobacter sp.]|nr:RDD family protein [Candidatus Sulfotelmatobacter sp.]
MQSSSTADANAELIAAAQVDSEGETSAEAGDGEAWRGELSERLNRYRARRKVRPPRYPSLSLRFEAFETTASSSRESLPHSNFEPVSNHALALDGIQREPLPRTETDVQARPSPEAELPQPAIKRASAGYARVGSTSAKIIEFPRFAWGPPIPPPDQLAEPVCEKPRILDVPEIEPPPPALGGITIEAIKREEPERRAGIDVPLQSASLGLRVVAAMVDGIILAAAAALFGFIFWKVAAVRPPVTQILGAAAAIPCLFWAVYQYLLVVYAGSTSGLRLAGLELTRFDGSSTTRSMRRWRVLAGYLSAVSLGMGYAWVLLDEDSLCWHDRITHTHFAPKKRASAKQP